MWCLGLFGSHCSPPSCLIVNKQNIWFEANSGCSRLSSFLSIFVDNATIRILLLFGGGLQGLLCAVRENIQIYPQMCLLAFESRKHVTVEPKGEIILCICSNVLLVILFIFWTCAKVFSHFNHKRTGSPFHCHRHLFT